MRVAIMIYGYFYIDEHMKLFRAPHSKKQLTKYSFIDDSYEHFLSQIYYPLQIKYGKENVDVYMIAHKFEHPKFDEIKKKLEEICSSFNIYWTNILESPRLTCSYFNLIKHCLNSKIKYDRHIITRNDLFYKISINSWLPNNVNPNYCWYLFKLVRDSCIL